MGDGDDVPRPRRQGRALLVISLLAAALMVIAAVNLALVFVLISASGTNPPNFLSYIAIGVLPFLATAALITWTVVGPGAATKANRTPRHIVRTLLTISVIGLPVMVVGGFWAGLFAAAQGLPVGSPEADALYIFQFTLVAAVVADGVTLVGALATRGGGSLPRETGVDQ
jgi:hypothetical protein